MHNVTHSEALGHEKTQALANVAAAVPPNPERNHLLGTRPVASASPQAPKNEVDHNGIAVLGVAGSGAANSDRGCVLAILREAYRVAHRERRRIQTDLDLLVGIARALEAYIYDPAYALGRAVELGLVAWTEIEVAP